MSAFGRAFAHVVLGAACFSFFACGESAPPIVGSETHFLNACTGSCGPGSECVCGVCTKSCGADAACTALGEGARCTALAPRITAGRCAASEPLAMCDIGCITAGDCASLGADYRCEGGYCRTGEAGPPPEAPACDDGSLVGSDVVILGDALITLSTFKADLEAAATRAGALPDGQRFRVYASSLMSILADGPLGIGNQWTTARAEGAARVVVMDGGATDVLNLPCGNEPSADCPAIVAAVAGAELLLSRLAADRVEHVVYFFYGDVPDDAALSASIAVLRPLVENACGRSGLACHFLDLRPTFDGHPEYLQAEVIFTDAGASVAADVVWDLMSERCTGF